uniref:Uncharacterized protein n=1 Tax=Anguilla anguilla TaxID=7936 RepID=A0A0E9Q6H4_ANGAN
MPGVTTLATSYTLDTLIIYPKE